MKPGRLDIDQTLRAIVDASPLAVLAVDADGSILFWSPAAERMFGWTEAEVLGQANPIVPPEKWEDYRATIARVLQGSSFSGTRQRARRRSGELFDISVSAAPLRDTQGRIAGVMALLEDITERRSAELERDRLLSQLRAVVDHIDTGIIISDLQGRILEANLNARQILGFLDWTPADWHEGRAWLELSTPAGELIPFDRSPRMRVLAGESFTGWELRTRRPDQDWERIISYGGTPVRDRDGCVVLALVTLRDTTDSWRLHRELDRKVKERTAELDQLNRILRALLRCNQAILGAGNERALLHEFCRISMDVEGIAQAWVGLVEGTSLRVAAAVGFGDQELAGTWLRWTDHDGPASLAIRKNTVQLAPSRPEEPSLFLQREENLGLGFGTVLALPLRRANHVLGVLVLSADSPELFQERQLRLLKELAANLSIGLDALWIREERDRALETAEHRASQLRAMSLRLGQTEQRERRRLAEVLHDSLQQLLVGASFNAEALKARIRARPALEILEHLSESLGEALEISRSMTLDLSPPIYHGKGLSAGLEWVADQMRRKHGLEVTLQIAGRGQELPDPVRMFLFEAVRELLLNVVKHAKVNRARVRVRPLEDGQIEITVTDQGRGFDPGRLQSPDSPGFGLFNIREKLHHLNGQLTIHSHPGQGSRFVLTLLCQAPGPVPTPSSTPVSR